METPSDREQPRDCGLSPEAIDMLAMLALASEKATALSDAMAEMKRAMAAATNQHPSLHGAWSQRLRMAVAVLENHLNALAQEVMHHSHLYEDLVEAQVEHATKRESGSA